MGVVYLAEDQHLGRRVAIKFLTSTDRHYRARFIREARAVSALSHANIAIVHDYGESASDQPFIVMEYVKGKALNDLLEEGLTLRRSVEIVSAITEALGEATVHLQQGESRIVGRGTSTDIIEASAKAYVDGLNKLVRLSAASA